MRRRVFLILSMIGALAVVFGTNAGGIVWKDHIANVTVIFSGAVSTQQETQDLVNDSIQALLPDAAPAGVTGLRLQSVNYTLSPGENGYGVSGVLFINVLPEEKTTDFAARLQKKGIAANVNYYRTCR